jgi:F-type H+-transporting ATPase subunit alpha
MSLEKQVASLYTVVKGHVDDIPVQDVTRFEAQFLAFLESNRPEVLNSIRDTKDITADNDKALVDAINTFKKSFAVSE